MYGTPVHPKFETHRTPAKERKGSLSKPQDDNQPTDLGIARDAAKRAKTGVRDWLGRSIPGTFSDESAAGLHSTLDLLLADLSGLNPAAMSSTTHSEMVKILENEIGSHLETSPAVYQMLRREPGTTPALVGEPAEVLKGPPSMAKALTNWVSNLPSFGAQRSATQAAINFGLDLDESRPIWLFGADHPSIQKIKLGPHFQPIDWSPGIPFPAQLGTGQAVILPGMLTALPDKVLVALLREVRPFLADDGLVVASGLRPSPDSAFTDLALNWPTIRRTPAQLMNLLLLAGFSVSQDVLCAQPGLVVVAVPTERRERDV
jgi:hypothetical protein